jgi:hypothetical protein
MSLKAYKILKRNVVLIWFKPVDFNILKLHSFIHKVCTTLHANLDALKSSLN